MCMMVVLNEDIACEDVDNNISKVERLKKHYEDLINTYKNNRYSFIRGSNGGEIQVRPKPTQIKTEEAVPKNRRANTNIFKRESSIRRSRRRRTVEIRKTDLEVEPRFTFPGVKYRVTQYDQNAEVRKTESLVPEESIAIRKNPTLKTATSTKRSFNRNRSFKVYKNEGLNVDRKAGIDKATQCGDIPDENDQEALQIDKDNLNNATDTNTADIDITSEVNSGSFDLKEDLSDLLEIDTEPCNFIFEAYNDDYRELMRVNILIQSTPVKFQSSRHEKEMITETANSKRANSTPKKIKLKLERFGRRRTICDEMGNVRIDSFEPITPGDKAKEGELEEISLNTYCLKNPGKRISLKLDNLVEEIKCTECKYVENLKKIVQIFMPYMKNMTSPLDDYLLGELFGNIVTIFEHQEKFLEAMQTCPSEINSIIELFIENVNLFDLYPIYFEIKPKLRMILRNFQSVIQVMQNGESFDFEDYLLLPLRRLGNYGTFMENIKKELTIQKMPCDRADKAAGILKDAMSKGNTYVAIKSIQNNPMNRLDHGSFIVSNVFILTASRRFESTVFLFSDVVIFTVKDKEMTGFYKYFDSIKMNDLTISTFEERIELTNYTRRKRSSIIQEQYKFTLETPDDSIKQNWIKTIEDILWDQLNKQRDMVYKSMPSIENAEHEKEMPTNCEADVLEESSPTVNQIPDKEKRRSSL